MQILELIGLAPHLTSLGLDVSAADPSSLAGHPGFGLLAAAADSSQDFFWENQIFKKPQWVGLMFGLRARRMGEYISPRLKRGLAILLAVLAFGAYFDFGNPNVRYSEYYHRHELYHYYLGSKYSEELGYKRLYDCTMIAEIENGRRSQIEKREFRDLRVNLIKKAKDTYIFDEPERCTKHFSEQRWAEFKKDVDWFYNSSRGSYWERMQQDHGYNPPPVWTMTGKALASLHPADGDYFKLLASIDVVLQAGMVVLLFWAFGYRVGAVGAIFWGCNAAANFYWTGGAFLRQDWLFLLVASLALCRKRYFFWAGAALMWSALLRVFPVALFGGWVAMVLIHVVERLRGRPSVDGKTGFLGLLHPDHRRLIAGALVALAVLVPASMAATGGPKAYKDFFAHIQTHKHTPLTNHMGLPTIISHNWDGRMRFTRNENLDDAFEGWKEGRNRRIEKLKVVQYGAFVAFFLWIAWALHRSRLLWLGPALSLPLVMCLTDLTCYYYSMYIAAAVLTLPRRGIGATLLFTGAASVLLLGKNIGYAPTNVSGFYFVDDNFAVQSYLFMLFSILMLWDYSRPFSLTRLKAHFSRFDRRGATPSPSVRSPQPKSAQSSAPA